MCQVELDFFFLPNLKIITWAMIPEADFGHRKTYYHLIPP